MAKLKSALDVTRISKPGFHRDAGEDRVRGLYLRVADLKDGSGVTKGWALRFVSPVTGKPRWMGLGGLRDVGLADARVKARQGRILITDGLDPIEAKNERIAAAKLEAAKRMTFGQCAKQYIETHKGSWKNSKHGDQWKSTFIGEKAATAAINDIDVAKVDTAIVLKVLNPIWLKTPETARRIRGRIESVLDWAKAGKFRTGENPARWRDNLKHLLAGHNGERGHHAALDYNQLPTFMAELRQRDSISARALEFTILCATRTNETINATWDEFNPRAKTWTIPASRMKAGKEHSVPLSNRAVEILDDLPSEGEFIFPGGRAGNPLSNMAMLELVRDMRPGITVHGFRSTFADWAGDCTNFDERTREFALAHGISDKTMAAYRRKSAIDKRRQLMADWARYCAGKRKARA